MATRFGRFGNQESGGNTWAIVLAGGDGERLSDAIQSWLKERRPKQYCTFTGSRSMLQHTLDRAGRIAAPNRIVTVVAKHHARFIEDAVDHPPPGVWIEQPRNKGTAAGVYLALAHVLASDPEATIALLPSDHFVAPESTFVQLMRRATSAARMLRRKMILLGAPAEYPECDYGWIVPGPYISFGAQDTTLRSVRQFREKPKTSQARTLWRNGGLWNTMVLTASGSLLWSLGWTLLPDMMGPFERLRGMLAHPGRDRRVDAFVEAAYEMLPTHCFSRDLVGRARQRTIVQRLDGVRWSDWGRPERIEETLRSLGKRPRFAQADSRAQALVPWSRGAAYPSVVLNR